MTTPREKYEQRRATFEAYVKAGEIDEDSAAAIRELLDAYDDDNIMVSKPPGESTRAVGTLKSWLYRLMTFARHRNLTTATAHDLNSDVQAMHDGTFPLTKDGGLKKSTLRSYQAALRKFYGHHDFGVYPGEIPLYDKADSEIDPNDVLTKEEMDQARKAARHPRDRLIFDLLLYTGQRREALRTLRIKDVSHVDGIYRLNPEVDGLKGAQERNGPRPLLGAKAAVKTWLDYHPEPDNPENYLITARPGYSAVDPSEPVSGETIRKVMANIKEAAGIQKPMHPHMMRHNFVTIAKRDYNLPDDTIKYLIGHSPESTVMETTYSHLSGADHVKRAEEAFGIRDPEEENPFTPDVCWVCSEPLGSDSKACSNCGTVYTPDARSVERQIEEALWESKSEATSEDHEEAVDKLRGLLREHPELIETLTERAK